MLLYTHRKHRLIRDGSPGQPPRLSHRSWPLTWLDDDDVELNVLRSWVDILGTNCDQRLSMVQCCFTSTETTRLVRMKSPGQPPRLSHSSWPLTWLGHGYWVFYSYHHDKCGGVRPVKALWSYINRECNAPYSHLWENYVRISSVGVCRVCVCTMQVCIHRFCFIRWTTWFVTWTRGHNQCELCCLGPVKYRENRGEKNPIIFSFYWCLID